MFDVVVVPTDGSEYAERAASTAFDLAEVHESAVHVVSVVDPGPLGDLKLPGDAQSASEALEAKATEFVERIATQARGRGIEVSAATPKGPPESEILAYAEDVDADLIVMGTRGRGGVRRAALGSVADHVIRFGDIRVLVETSTPDLE